MNIVLIDDQPAVLEHVGRLLQDRGHTVTAFANAPCARDFLRRSGRSVGLILTDLDLGAGVEAGLDFLSELRGLMPRCPIFVLSGKGTVPVAVASLKRGATDFIEKDVHLSDYIDAAVHKAEGLARMLEMHASVTRERDALQKQTAFYMEEARRRYNIVGQSPALQKALAEARLAADLPRPVLILGERGTGKELVAAYIHYAGSRKDGPFITVNCAALTGNLLESELFGHERGAFTGAAERRIGRFELADKGTLFLDEIGNMSLDFQQKMLRVIEYQRFERVQGTETISVNVRVIAATNADLAAMIDQGAFRADLYDRLAFRTIRVPPFRDRKEDIPALVQAFTDALLREMPDLPRRTFSDDALERLRDYDWPGNVRELRYTVERLVCTPGPENVAPHEITFATPSRAPASLENNFEQRVLRLQRELIENALSRCDGNQKRAAESISLTYDQFRHYLRKFRKRDDPA